MAELGFELTPHVHLFYFCRIYKKGIGVSLNLDLLGYQGPDRYSPIESFRQHHLPSFLLPESVKMVFVASDRNPRRTARPKKGVCCPCGCLARDTCGVTEFRGTLWVIRLVCLSQFFCPFAQHDRPSLILLAL